jgi:hypothetical protein
LDLVDPNLGLHQIAAIGGHLVERLRLHIAGADDVQPCALERPLPAEQLNPRLP